MTAPVSAIPPNGGPILSALAALERMIGWICKFVIAVTGSALLATITIAVIGRYIMDVGGFDWAEELPKQLFAWFIMAGVVLAVLRGDHIAVDIIETVLPEAVKRWLIVAMNLLVAAAYLYLATSALEVADIAKAEINPVLGTPGSLPYFALVTGAVLVAVGVLIIAARVALLGSTAAPKGRPEDSVQ